MRSIILVLLLLTGCSNLPKPTVEQAALADIGTTAYLLNHGGIELNPLGFAGTTALKGLFFYYKDDMTPATRKESERIATSIWTGAAVNNLLQILWAPPLFWSIGLGVVVGIELYNK
jgi:hypothetical protein